MGILLACPDCQTPLDEFQRCPNCSRQGDPGVQPLSAEPPPRPFDRPEKWQQTAGGRIVIGVILAAGLCYGLLQLCTAVLRALDIEGGSDAISPATGLVLFQGLQALALLGGGLLAGVGQRRGVAFGAIVGVISGMLFLAGMLNGIVSTLVQTFASDLLMPGDSLRSATLYGMPILHALFGAIGGLIGSSIWKPLPQLSLPLGMGKGPLAGIQNRLTSRPRMPQRPLIPWTGPVSWFRVAIGTVIAVTGAVWTKGIIDFILMASEGKLSVMTNLEDQVVYGEIFSISILLGGIFAGATTYNGLKQGMAVGFLAAVCLAGIFVNGYLTTSTSVVFPMMSTVFLGPIGGWFGCELLPPVFKAARIRRKKDPWF
jgi:hypothetical protein